MSLMRRLSPDMHHIIRQVESAFAPILSTRFPYRHFDPIIADSLVPPADIRETEEKYLIETEMPGVSKDDVKFELADDHTILVHGETKRPDGQEKRVGERFFGMLDRAFTIPTKIDPGKVAAELHNGVLTIEIAKVSADREPLQVLWKN